MTYEFLKNNGSFVGKHDFTINDEHAGTCYFYLYNDNLYCSRKPIWGASDTKKIDLPVPVPEYLKRYDHSTFAGRINDNTYTKLCELCGVEPKELWKLDTETKEELTRLAEVFDKNDFKGFRIEIGWEDWMYRYAEEYAMGNPITEQEEKAINDVLEKIFSAAHKNQEIELEFCNRPVGRIDYYAPDGSVCESIEYTDADKFVENIKDDNYCGVPMDFVLYKDKNGNTIPKTFLSDLDPIRLSAKCIDNPYSFEEGIEDEFEL